MKHGHLFSGSERRSRVWRGVGGAVLVMAATAAQAEEPELAQVDFIDHATTFQEKLPGAWVEQAGDREHAVQVVREPVRYGDTALRFEQRATDMPLENRGERAEILRLDFEENGREYWHGVSLMIPEGSEWPMTSRATRILQWHAYADGDLGEKSRSPVLEFTLDRGKFRISAASDPTELTIDNQVQHARLYEPGTTLEQGVWHDIVVNVKWGYGGDGFVRIWLDGEQIVDYVGGVGYNDKVGPYVKMGIYRRRDPGNHDAVIYHDEYRRGESREAVDIRLIAGPPAAAE